MQSNINLLFKTIFKFIKIKLFGITSLQDGTDVEGTIDYITTNIDIKGSNIWILFCAAMLASIGLDVNSTAVIIGAMLISPLMSPILGIGLAVGTYDKDILINSLKNFGFAIILSLTFSVIYFTLTPLGLPTSELLARTSPTLLDVGVAFFGGVAGIIATSRKDKSNAIPGVAIATALMPPLCTVGYGIANLDFSIMFGAFYLFFLNAVFISLSTYLIVRLLNFPIKHQIDLTKEIKIKKYVWMFVIIVMMPSLYILYSVVIEARTNKAIQTFMEKEVKNEDYEAIKWEIVKDKDKVKSNLNNKDFETLKLYVVGADVKQTKIEYLENRLKYYNLNDYKLKIIQMNIGDNDKEQIKKELSGEVALSVIKQMQSNNELLNVKRSKLDSLQGVIDDYTMNNNLRLELEKELAIIYPDITNFRYGIITEIDSSQNNNLQNNNLQKDNLQINKIIIADYKGDKKEYKTEVEVKLKKYLQSRLKTENINLIINKQ